jgi:hypothetical protein
LAIIQLWLVAIKLKLLELQNYLLGKDWLGLLLKRNFTPELLDAVLLVLLFLLPFPFQVIFLVQTQVYGHNHFINVFYIFHKLRQLHINILLHVNT